MRVIHLVVALVTLLIALAIASPNWPIIDVTADEQVMLENTIRVESANGHTRAVKRYRAILLLGAGERVADVAEHLHCSTQAVYQWIGQWRDRRFDGVRFKMNERRPPHYKQKAHYDERIAQILAMRETGLKWDAIAAALGYKTRAGPLRCLQRALDTEEEE